jgi:hypothetical protein
MMKYTHNDKQVVFQPKSQFGRSDESGLCEFVTLKARRSLKS